MSAVSRVAMTDEQAHAACLEAFRIARAIIRSGRGALIACSQAEEPVRIAQRQFLHAGVLPQIAEQAQIAGHHWTVPAWKEAFRTMFLPNGGWRWRESKLPRWDAEKRRFITPRRARILKERISTEELGVAAYARMTDQIIDYAAHELGVVFEFTAEQEQSRRRPTTIKEKNP